MIIEAKRPTRDLGDRKIRERALNQARHYGRESDAEQVLVTNGRDWIAARPAADAPTGLTDPSYEELEAMLGSFRYETGGPEEARAVETIRRLIAGQVDVEKAAVELGGYDHHAETTHGNAYQLGSTARTRAG